MAGEDDNLDAPTREQDRLLPIANVGKIMKKSLPKNAKISKEAKETIQECVTEFILFLTSEASDRCQLEKRKTINGDDILFSLQALGFDPYYEPMRHYLEKYRHALKGDKNTDEDEKKDNFVQGQSKRTEQSSNGDFGNTGSYVNADFSYLGA